MISKENVICCGILLESLLSPFIVGLGGGGLISIQMSKIIMVAVFLIMTILMYSTHKHLEKKGKRKHIYIFFFLLIFSWHFLITWFYLRFNYSDCLPCP